MVLPAGLKAAAAAALKALAESGKSTVFFEDSDDDEAPTGMKAPAHIATQPVNVYHAAAPESLSAATCIQAPAVS